MKHKPNPLKRTQPQKKKKKSEILENEEQAKRDHRRCRDSSLESEGKSRCCASLATKWLKAWSSLRAWAQSRSLTSCDRCGPLDVIATESWASWTSGCRRRRPTTRQRLISFAFSGYSCEILKKKIGFNFCLGALKMEEKGKELKFEYGVFCLLENKTHSYIFWNRKVFVFVGFLGSEFLKF